VTPKLQKRSVERILSQHPAVARALREGGANLDRFTVTTRRPDGSVARRREVYRLTLGGVEINSMADWRSYLSPLGFTRLALEQLPSE